MNDLLSRIHKVQTAALGRIKLDQNPRGGFPSLSATTLDFTNAIGYNTTFFPSLILACLSAVDATAATSIKIRISNFLLRQKSPSWSFNYWDRGSQEFSSLPYPDDLDDTFCALGAMAAADPALITGQTLANAVTLLTAQEVQPGGPYRTWLVTADAAAVWQDVDMAVNCNIAWFLSQQRVKLSDLVGLNEFIIDRLSHNNFQSPYYYSSFPLIYFLARAYGTIFCRDITDFLWQQKTDRFWGNVLNTSLAISGLLRCGVAVESLEPAIIFLLDEYERHGWQPQPFCFDPSRHGKKYFAGSASLTAAMCWEALALYKKALTKTAITPDPAAQRIYRAVVETVTQRLTSLSPQLQQSALTELQQTLRRDKDQQIVLLPYWFAQSLAEQKLDEQFLLQLGAANLYGWLAYTIYDNIMDEARQISLLPVANVCLREVINIHHVRPLFQSIMDKIEAANTWEINNARTATPLPDYGDYTVLADKSFGHALGPLTVLSQLGYDDQSPAIENTIKLFQHYLIARQLNDDAHDWQADLQKGQFNSVAVMILLQWQQASDFDLTKDLPKLQELFWHTTIHEVSELIQHHINQARAYRQRLTIIKDYQFLENILQPLEQAANQATEESTKTQDFLTTYNI